MFTGLIESVGQVVNARIDRDGVGRFLAIEAAFAAELALGESVSVNGTCLTVVEHGANGFGVQVSPTTLQLTTLGQWLPGQRVNLERSVTPSTRLGGHWVLGHVDTVGQVASVAADGESRHISLLYPSEYQRWVLPQGSITLDGISLTIVECAAGRLGVTIIPHTWQHTNVQDWESGTAINLEFDVLGKYAEHLLAPYASLKGETPS